VDVYPRRASTYRLIEDEGVTDFSCVRDSHGLTFTWAHGPERALTLRFHGAGKPLRIAVRTSEAGATQVLAERWKIAADGAVEVHVGRCANGGLRMEGQEWPR
jgi:hypothetical protein